MDQFFDYLNDLRVAELELTLKRWDHYFAGRDLLEIGSGSGVQLERLSTVSRSVQGVDLGDSIYRKHRSDAVVEYDGINLPFADHSFDIVYSSNVLEHLQDPEPLHREMQRVLRPGGTGLHIMPNHVWRLWSHLSHYPALPKKIYRRFRARSRASENDVAAGNSRSPLRLLANVLADPRHGEFGNRFTESIEFHPSRWRSRLQRLGWVLVTDEPSGLFYTGGGLLAGSWSFDSRTRWARHLGSACHTYIVATSKSSS